MLFVLALSTSRMSFIECSCLARLMNTRKRPVEVFDQVLHVLKADVQAHRLPARGPFRRGAAFFRRRRYAQAFETAPRRAHAKMRASLDEGGELRPRSRLHDETKESDW